MNRRETVEDQLRRLAPAIPRFDLGAVADHALASRGLQTASPDKAAWLSLVAYVRHVYTGYEDLLADGYGAEAARHFCRDQINGVLAGWGCRRTVGESEDDEQNAGQRP
ncbi:MAG TPA: DUF2293 domain-containing protein [Rhodospirillaceae bacterium]|nr:DUF2293 domain-containing protein [Rhodospirillaceae bacterium]